MNHKQQQIILARNPIGFRYKAPSFKNLPKVQKSSEQDVITSEKVLENFVTITLRKKIIQLTLYRATLFNEQGFMCENVLLNTKDF